MSTLHSPAERSIRFRNRIGGSQKDDNRKRQSKEPATNSGTAWGRKKTRTGNDQPEKEVGDDDDEGEDDEWQSPVKYAGKKAMRDPSSRSSPKTSGGKGPPYRCMIPFDHCLNMLFKNVEELW